MDKIKNLSDEFIELNDIFSHKSEVSFDEISNDVIWSGCKDWYFYRHANWSYFFIQPKGRNSLVVGRSGSCQLRKINKGYLKDCYVVVEQGHGETKLSVFGDNGILKLPEYKERLKLEQIDSIFDNKNFEMLTAVVLHSYDIQKKLQDYQLFCDRLPTRCLKSKMFKTEVFLNFISLGDINVSNVADMEGVNVDYYQNKALKYFDKLTTLDKESVLKK